MLKTYVLHSRMSRKIIDVYFTISEAALKTSTHSLYFTMRHFPRFHYIYNLIRDCKSRTEKCTNGEVKLDKMFKNVFIEIVIVGSFTDDDLHLLTKSAGSVLFFSKLGILLNQNMSMTTVLKTF